jgi:AcrR family transcriptional regulator
MKFVQYHKNFKQVILVKIEKPDRRVKYTKMVLKQSLLELMENKPINQITIKEICDLADVNRGTFYKHYNDQYDLLKQIQEELDFEIKATLNNNLSDTASSSKIITEIIHCIAEQNALCKILFTKHGDTEFLRKIMYNAHSQCINEWQSKSKQNDIQQLEMFYIFIANGISAVVQNWLRNGMKEKPHEIAAFIENATNHGLTYFLTCS